MLSVKNMLKRALATIGVAALTLSLFAGCQKISKPIEKLTNDYDIDGLYGVKISAKEGYDNATTSMFIRFDKSNMTYEDFMTAGDLSYTVTKGTYEVDEANDKVFLHADTGYEESFTIYGDFIMADNLFYEGPEITGSILSGNYTLTSDEADKTIAFRQDGNYTYGISTSSSPNTGTYEVKGCMVYLNSSDGSVKVPFLICSDTTMTNSYYQKMPEE